MRRRRVCFGVGLALGRRSCSTHCSTARLPALSCLDPSILFNFRLFREKSKIKSPLIFLECGVHFSPINKRKRNRREEMVGSRPPSELSSVAATMTSSSRKTDTDVKAWLQAAPLEKLRLRPDTISHYATRTRKSTTRCSSFRFPAPPRPRLRNHSTMHSTAWKRHARISVRR